MNRAVAAAASRARRLPGRCLNALAGAAFWFTSDLRPGGPARVCVSRRTAVAAHAESRPYAGPGRSKRWLGPTRPAV